MRFIHTKNLNMLSTLYNLTTPKKTANLSINADLLRQVKQFNIILSQLLKQQLTEIVWQTQRSQWLTENQLALQAYHQHIDLQGAFSDSLRQF